MSSSNLFATGILMHFMLISISLIIMTSATTGREVVNMCGGESFTCFVFDDKRMKCVGLKKAWGLSLLNDDYLLDGKKTPSMASPYVNVGTGVGIDKVACGKAHICMKLSTGKLKCLGDKGSGKLGLGISSATNPIGEATGYIGDALPVVNLGTGFKVADVAVGAHQSYALSLEGKVRCFGYNEYGQLGLENTSGKGVYLSDMGDNLPIVNFGTNVTIGSIHSGPFGYHACVILSAPSTSAGRIKCWGYNGSRELGYGDSNHRGDQVGEMGDNLPLVDLGTESRVKQLGIGYTHTCALLVSNYLKCFGSAGYGELASGSTAIISSTGNSLPFVAIDSGRTIKLLSVGRAHTCITYDDNITMKCVGTNQLGQLGQGDIANRGSSPATMFPNISEIDLGIGSSTIKLIMAGMNHNCVAFTNSTIKCFGSNGSGELGIGNNITLGDGANEMGNNLPETLLFRPFGTTTNAPSKSTTKSPTSVPTRNPTRAPISAPYNLPITKPLNAICLGDGYSCFLFNNKQVKCAGRKLSFGASIYGSDSFGNDPNTIGDNLPYLNVSSIPSVVDIKCGANHICFKFDSNDVKCIGSNANGQIGIGVTTDPIGSATEYKGDFLPFVNFGNDIKVKQIAVAAAHNCVLATNSKVKCFGEGSFRKLGLNDSVDRGKSLSDMGNNLPFVNLGTGVEIDSIHTGSTAYHTCAILSKPANADKRFKCWGFNLSCQLGYGDSQCTFDSFTQIGDNLPLVDLGTESRVKQLALGEQHTCAQLVDDTIKCWGSGFYGRLASGSTSDITSTGNALPAVMIDSGEIVKLASAGSRHTCIVYDDMITMKCFGQNDYGQLGQSDDVNRGDTPTTMISSLPAIDLGSGSIQIKSILAGSRSTCVVFADDNVKCFGYNDYGMFLYEGYSWLVGDEPKEMGIYLPYVQLFSPTKSPSTSPTKKPTPSPTSPTKNPSKSPTKKPTTSPTSPSSISILYTSSPSSSSSVPASTTSLPQSTQIAIGVSVSVFGIVAIALIMLFRHKNRTNKVELKEYQSYPTSAMSIGKV